MKETQTFFRFLAETYYTIPIMVGFQIVATVVSFKNKNKFDELSYFHFYPLSGLMQSFISVASILFLKRTISFKVEESSVNLFSIAEASLFYFFSLHVIRLKKLRMMLTFLFVTFVAYTAYVWVMTDSFLHNSSKIICAESLFILLATYFYFLELFKFPPTQNILENPPFWINIGFLFVFSCTLPLTTLDFIQRVVSPNFYLYYMNFITYTVLYLLVTKAYLCKNTNRKISLPDMGKDVFATL